MAVTGSMNQQGDIQEIGGVNEKIEGFFDVCRIAGLSGTQGVMIPASNVEDLMLREDVLEAVAAGEFSILAGARGGGGVWIFHGVAAGCCNRDGNVQGSTTFS